MDFSEGFVSFFYGEVDPNGPGFLRGFFAFCSAGCSKVFSKEFYSFSMAKWIKTCIYCIYTEFLEDSCFSTVFSWVLAFLGMIKPPHCSCFGRLSSVFTGVPFLGFDPHWNQAAWHFCT